MFDNISNLSLLDKRKQDLLSGVNTNYADVEKQLAEQEALYGQQAQTRTGEVQGQLGQQKTLAEQQALANTRGARSTYADLLTQSRRQARATGGGASSGAMELYNKLDRDLMSQLSGFGMQRANTINQAQMTADTALRDIQDKLTEYTNTINTDRRTSLREKQSKILDIEFQAQQAADSIKTWLRQQAAYYASQNQGTPTVEAPQTNGFGLDTGEESPVQTANRLLIEGRANQVPQSGVSSNWGTDTVPLLNNAFPIFDIGNLTKRPQYTL